MYHHSAQKYVLYGTVTSEVVAVVVVVVVSFYFAIKHSYNMITNSLLVKIINLTLFKISLAIITIYIFTNIVFG